MDDEQNPLYDYSFKLNVIGDAGVGKSCLLLRFADDDFVHCHKNTIGVDFKIRSVNVQGKNVKLQIWDTCGAEQYRTFCAHYYRYTQGIAIVYDSTKLHTFNNVKDIWLNEIEINAPESANKILIGNKCDMVDEKVVSYETGKSLADSLNIPFFEASAKDSTNVNEAFALLASKILDRVKSEPLRPSKRKVINIEEPQQYGFGYGYLGCC